MCGILRSSSKLLACCDSVDGDAFLPLDLPGVVLAGEGGLTIEYK